MKFKYEKPQNGYPEWNNNPQIVSLNMNKPHNDFVSYETKEQAIEGIKENEEVLTLKIKVKDKVKKESTKVTLKDLTSNDGENLVNIGDKEININFEGVKAVNTGDNTIILVTGIMLAALVTYLISIKKDVKE